VRVARIRFPLTADLGPDFFDNRIRPERRKHNHIRQIEALGDTVAPAPAPPSPQHHSLATVHFPIR
jgi:hypothetical protein